MTRKRKRVLVVVVSAAFAFLLLTYSFGGFFIPALNTTHKETFELVVSDIPRVMSVGDELTVTAHLRNRSLRFFHVGYGSMPIEIAILRKGEVHRSNLPLNYGIMLPLGSFSGEATVVFLESGEYFVSIKTAIALGNREFGANDYVFEYQFEEFHFVVE